MFVIANIQTNRNLYLYVLLKYTNMNHIFYCVGE